MSALVFSQACSLTRRLFKEEEPKWITIKPAMGDRWSSCLQTVESHSDSVDVVAFSHDSTRLASASWDRTVKIWDTSSCECLQTLKGHSSLVSAVAHSHSHWSMLSINIAVWSIYRDTELHERAFRPGPVFRHVLSSFLRSRILRNISN